MTTKSRSSRTQRKAARLAQKAVVDVGALNPTERQIYLTLQEIDKKWEAIEQRRLRENSHIVVGSPVTASLKADRIVPVHQVSAENTRTVVASEEPTGASWLAFFMAFFLRVDEAEAIVGDLIERHRVWCTRFSKSQARVLFWYHALSVMIIASGRAAANVARAVIDGFKWLLHQLAEIGELALHVKHLWAKLVVGALALKIVGVLADRVIAIIRDH